ncbi:MAG: amidohydrolase [Fusobacterium sp. JB019]|nr:amidohydrolase [Fusobacterium sp. JB019]MDP0506549.1 amidohydrolase [Fusobacterium sp. JB019]
MKFSEIEEVIDSYIEEVICFRRDLHEYPELGGKEKRTPLKVLEALRRLPLEIKENVGANGIVANLFGNEKTGNKKTILIRGDMDALPIQEENNLTFISKNKGVMHACGHDMHTSMVLGTAMVLSKFKDKLKGNVKFMFQPAEECSPTGGSRGMMDAGLLINPSVDEAYALHVYNSPVGSISFRPGVANAKSDAIQIHIKGKSSHGSMPSQGRDAIVTAANIIMAIQTIVSRNLESGENAVVTIGKMSGGNRYNVIADYVILEGTVRVFSDESALIIKKRLHKLVNDICSAYGCEGKLIYKDGYDFMYNDLELSKEVINSLTPLIGRENIEIQKTPSPGGEDFSFITKKVPSVFMWIGTESNINEGKCILHNPNFIADEATLKEGIKIFTKIILDRFKNLED